MAELIFKKWATKEHIGSSVCWALMAGDFISESFSWATFLENLQVSVSSGSSVFHFSFSFVFFFFFFFWAVLYNLLLLLSRSVVSDPLWPHRLQHARRPCCSPSPRACSNSCLLSLWCHPTISSYVIPFSSCLQSFPASGSFPMSRLFESAGQSIGASASASVLPRNIQGWFPWGLTGLISLQSKGLSRVFSNTIV